MLDSTKRDCTSENFLGGKYEGNFKKSSIKGLTFAHITIIQNNNIKSQSDPNVKIHNSSQEKLRIY